MSGDKDLRTSDIAGRLKGFLERKDVPNRFKNNVDLQSAERKALLGAILRKAPRDHDAIREWWTDFEIILGESCGSIWPNERDIAQAIEKMPKPIFREDNTSDRWKIDSLSIHARRMNAGEPIAEDALFGKVACELILNRMISKEVMESYRKGAWHNRASIYGEEKANQWLSEMELKHNAAKAAVLSRHHNHPTINQGKISVAATMNKRIEFDNDL